MGDDMDSGTDDDGPRSGFVEGDVLVERDNVIEGSFTKKGDEVAADGKKDEYDIDVENKGGGTGDGECYAKKRSCGHRVVTELIMEKAKDRNEQMKENPSTEENLSSTVVDHPDIDFLLQSHRLGRSLVGGSRFIGSEKALEFPSFRLHTLEVSILNTPS
jgi:hypothetical protein